MEEGVNGKRATPPLYFLPPSFRSSEVPKLQGTLRTLRTLLYKVYLSYQELISKSPP